MMIECDTLLQFIAPGTNLENQLNFLAKDLLPLTTTVPEVSPTFLGKKGLITEWLDELNNLHLCDLQFS